MEFPMNHVTESQVVPDFDSISKKDKQRIKNPINLFCDLYCYKEFATKLMPLWAKLRKLSHIKIAIWFFQYARPRKEHLKA